jgi:hypothetical protein
MSSSTISGDNDAWQRVRNPFLALITAGSLDG